MPILYKLGQKDEALQWEEKALELFNGVKEIEDNIEKVKKDMPAWN